MKRRLLFGILVIVASVSAAGAQTTPVDRMRTGVAAEIRDTDGRALGIANDLDYFALVARRALLFKVLQQNEEGRADKQLGATSSGGGTTTLVSKGTVPKILAFAVENGAITRSQSETTMTFRGNLGGAVRALSGRGLFQIEGDDVSLSILNRASFSVSFDTSRGAGDAANTFTGDQQQISQWTFRYQALNQRDPQGSTALREWNGGLTQALVTVSRASQTLAVAFEADPEFQQWLSDTATAVANAKTAAVGAKKTATETARDIADVMAQRESAFPIPAKLKPDTVLALEKWDQSTSFFVQKRQELLNRLKSGALVSLEYTNDRPLKAPKTSNLRLVGEVGGAVDVTGNASITLFDGDIPLGADGRVRDFQAAGELAFKMGSVTTVGVYVLSLSGKFVHQFENSYDASGIMLPDTKGTTAIGQLKLTIPAGAVGAGVKIPLSVTIANRTDLIKERIVRGNIGLSYDLDPLFSRLRP